MTDTDSADSSPSVNGDTKGEPAGEKPGEKGKKKSSTLREGVILVLCTVLFFWVMQTFVARPYLIPSESMEPTLHGCYGCTGDRIMVDKITYDFSNPKPGDVIVFKGPPNWNIDYKSIRSHNTAIRWVQNVLSVIGFVPPDENDLVKRVVAVGGQTVQCRESTGLTVDDKPLDQPFLDPATLNYDPRRCLGPEFGPVKVPDGRLWVMGDNRTHSADSRAHCTSTPADAQRGIQCTGDPNSGTIPVDNVIGKARFIAWPPSRWGLVRSVNIQAGK